MVYKSWKGTTIGESQSLYIMVSCFTLAKNDDLALLMRKKSYVPDWEFFTQSSHCHVLTSPLVHEHTRRWSSLPTFTDIWFCPGRFSIIMVLFKVLIANPYLCQCNVVVNPWSIKGIQASFIVFNTIHGAFILLQWIGSYITRRTLVQKLTNVHGPKFSNYSLLAEHFGMGWAHPWNVFRLGFSVSWELLDCWLVL